MKRTRLRALIAAPGALPGVMHGSTTSRASSAE